MKPGIVRLAKDYHREVYVERFGSLQVLFIKLGLFSSQLQQGDLSVLPNLCITQLEIEAHYKFESEKIFVQARTTQTASSEKSQIYHHSLLKRNPKRPSILKLDP